MGKILRLENEFHDQPQNRQRTRVPCEFYLDLSSAGFQFRDVVQDCFVDFLAVLAVGFNYLLLLSHAPLQSEHTSVEFVYFLADCHCSLLANALEHQGAFIVLVVFLGLGSASA